MAIMVTFFGPPKLAALASAYRATSHFYGSPMGWPEPCEGSSSSRWLRFAMSPACKHLCELSQSV
jgi:hypothetical protein